MRKYLSRLAMAFVFSSGCFVTTWYLFGKDGGTKDRNGHAPIAKLYESFNEVQRKPLGKMVWEAVTQGEDLFAGEDIRTSSASSAKIFLNQSKTVIELDPDSTIRLEQNPNGLALNFLAGNMLVKGSGEGVVLKSGENSIALNNADLSLSKSATGAVDLEVLKGKAQLTQNGKATTLDQSHSGTLGENGLEADKTRIRVTFPLAGEAVFVDPSKKEPVLFQWEKLPDGYEVHLERGPSREALAKIDGAVANGPAGELKSLAKLGKHYFRLVAIPGDASLPTMTSKILPFEVSAKTPPILLEPQADGLVLLDTQQPHLALKWASRAPFDGLVLEVAKDMNLQTVVAKKDLAPDASRADLEWKDPGTFFWRVTGFIRIRGKLEPISSPVFAFNVKVGIDLIPPKLKSPMPDQHLTFQQVSTLGLFLSWTPVPGIDRYHLRIEKKGVTAPVFDREITANPLRLTDFKSGAYTWSMTSLDKDAKPSAPSERRQFVIEEMPRLEWLDGNGLTEYLYFTQQPSFNVAWSKAGEAVVKYRVRWAKENDLSEKTEWHSASQTLFSAEVPQDGVYEVEVEGLDKADTTVARTSVKSIRVRLKPLLPPPTFASDTPEQLKADRKGALNFAWGEVKGATQYRVSIKSPDGATVVNNTTVERTIASLNRMKPGKYSVTLSSIDEHKRPGPEGSPRPLDVPDTSDIRAPKIKQFKVK